MPKEVTERRYPLSWRLNIDDGARHPEVVPGGKMEPIHDVYAACMAILCCWDKDNILKRNQKLKLGLLVAADACLGDNGGDNRARSEDIITALINFVGEIDVAEEDSIEIPDAQGTGSPPTPEK